MSGGGRRGKGVLLTRLPGGAALSSSRSGVVAADIGRGPGERRGANPAHLTEGPETAQPPRGGDARGAAPVTEASRRQPPPR